MIIGACSAVAKTLEDSFKAISEEGLDLIEIICEYSLMEIDDITEERRRYIKELASSYNLRLSVHAPFWDIAPCSRNSGIRNESKRQIIKTIDFTRDIGADFIVIHTGMRQRSRYNEEDPLRFLIESLKECAQSARESGVNIAVENTYEELAEDIIGLLDKLNEDNCWMLLDIGHLHIAAPDQVIPCLEVIKDRLISIHMHNNYGEKDDHLSLAEGTIDIEGFVNKLVEIGYDKYIVFEMAGQDSIRDSKKILLDLKDKYEVMESKKR